MYSHHCQADWHIHTHVAYIVAVSNTIKQKVSCKWTNITLSMLFHINEKGKAIVLMMIVFQIHWRAEEDRSSKQTHHIEGDQYAVQIMLLRVYETNYHVYIIVRQTK